MRTAWFMLAVCAAVPASAAEVWVLPADEAATRDTGDWATTKDGPTHFSVAIPDDFEAVQSVSLLLLGQTNGWTDTAELHLDVDLSVSSDGLEHDAWTDEAEVDVVVTDGVLAEVDVTDLFDVPLAAGVDYASIEVDAASNGCGWGHGSDGHWHDYGHGSGKVRAVGLRFAYTSTDTDTDADNELNISLQLNGHDLELTDAGGTLVADLSSLDDSAAIAAEELRAIGREDEIEDALEAHEAADGDLDDGNELNQAVGLSGTDLTVTDAGGSLTADLSSLEESAAILAEEIRAMAREDAIETALNAHVAADGDLDDGNELNTAFGLSGTDLTVTDAGGPLTASLASLEESADILAEELRAIAREDAIEGKIDTHVAADGDLSDTNELQTLSQNGLMITLSDGGGSFSLADGDASDSNELQSLSFAGTTLSISDGNSVSLGSLRDNMGNHDATQEIDMNGYDIDFERGDLGQIQSVGTISFDWTAGTYDSSQYHGIESKSEFGVMSDNLRINSYNDVIVTLDSNDNNGQSWFVVQRHSTGNGADLFWVDGETGRVWGRHESRTDSANTGYDDDGNQNCPGSRVAYGFDTDADLFGAVDRIRFRCAYVQ